MRYGSSSRESGAPADFADDSVTLRLVHRDDALWLERWCREPTLVRRPAPAQVYLERAASLPLSPMHREKSVTLIGASVGHPEVRQRV
jgi:hypothetical protein